jgi:hypothetical protein
MFQSLEEINKKYKLDFQDNNPFKEIILEIFNSSELDNSKYDLNNIYLLNAIGLYYRHVKKDYEFMIKYYLICIKYGFTASMFNLQIYFENKDLEFYHLLVNIDNKNKLMNDKIEELSKKKEVIYYKTKVIKMEELKNIHECCICFENKVNIIMYCGHDVCIDCYPNIINQKCSQCREEDK